MKNQFRCSRKIFANFFTPASANFSAFNRSDPYRFANFSYSFLNNASEFATVSKIDICSQSKMAGPCRGLFRRWYYNPVTRRCSRFVYGGCEGNGNNFNSSHLCQQICGFGQNASFPNDSDACSKPLPDDPAVPLCKNESSAEKEHLWYFNATISTCQKFRQCLDHVASGNRSSRFFRSGQECVSACGGEEGDDEFYDEAEYELKKKQWASEEEDYEEEEEENGGGYPKCTCFVSCSSICLAWFSFFIELGRICE